MDVLPPLPPPPLLRHNSMTSSRGFRLLDEQIDNDTSSIYSIYKQKIDQMFEFDANGGVQSNTVQARIEKMFHDVALDAKTDVNCHVFSVDYLGSIPLQEKVSTLTGLQIPLKDLYFSYKRSPKNKSGLSGKLEISAAGLKVRYQGDKGDLEQLNPFPTIAVWSAVKFVYSPNNSFAFLPLITDPDNIDKQSLFQKLDESEFQLLGNQNQNHSPLFAVVMRKIGLHKQLECHGFICQTSEDAIVIAATLYKSLMSHMKNKRPKNKNGVSCMSASSSICTESITNLSVPIRPPRRKRSTASSTDDNQIIADSPKKSIKSKKAPMVPNENNNKRSQSEDMDEIVPYEEPNLMGVASEKEDSNNSCGNKDDECELKRTRSVRRRNEEGESIGDILTKVTIPRSGSFLNTSGLTKYKSKINRTNGLTSGGSPLGFSELFTEFRLQENLHSLDEILAAIIDPKGMSYNNLKPIYKEFLLKLAVTLTKDELYQRAKAIMRRKRRERINKKPLGVTGLKKIFRKSFRLNLAHKLKNKKKKKMQSVKSTKKPVNQKISVAESSISTSSYDTGHFRPKETNAQRKQSHRRKQETKDGTRSRRISTSEDSDFFTMRRRKTNKCSPTNNQNRNSSSGYVSCSECSYDSDSCTCVSADKCYCSLGNRCVQKTQGPKLRPGSSCRSCQTSEDLTLQSLTWCGCDTDSCTDSNKCYCQNINSNRLLEQYGRKQKINKKQKYHETTQCEMNQGKKLKNLEDHKNMINKSFLYSKSYSNCLECSNIEGRKLCKKNSNTRSTKSVEYMHNPPEKYYEQLQHDDLCYRKEFRRRSYSDNNLSSPCEYFGPFGRAMSEIGPQTNQIQSSLRSVKSYGGNHRRLQKSIVPTTSTEALSVKKSAEIAALFTDLKLSQTTDITHLLPQNSPLRITNQPNQRNDNKKAIVTPYKHVSHVGHANGNRMVQNSLYHHQSRMMQQTSVGGSNKTALYSARNGLYTIQSQSDSSSSENTKKKGLKKNVSSIENTLGYLP